VTATRLRRFLNEVRTWAESQPDIAAVVLVGSQARGQATPESDVDLVILTTQPARYLQEPSWLERFGRPSRQMQEDWGRVIAVRVWYQGGLVVEFGITTPDWAQAPLNEGTRRVLDAGFVLVFDRGGKFAFLRQS
jgi:predicted nucleotidyltransferase